MSFWWRWAFRLWSAWGLGCIRRTRLRRWIRSPRCGSNNHDEALAWEQDDFGDLRWAPNSLWRADEPTAAADEELRVFQPRKACVSLTPNEARDDRCRESLASMGMSGDLKTQPAVRDLFKVGG